MTDKAKELITRLVCLGWEQLPANYNGDMLFSKGNWMCLVPDRQNRVASWWYWFWCISS